MRYRPLLGALLIGALMVPLTSCTNDPSLTAIVINPSAFTTSLVFLPNGQPAPQSQQVWTQYTATGYYTHPGHQPVTKDLTNQVNWISYTPLLVTMSDTGVATVTGWGTGFTQIGATMKGFHGIVLSNFSVFTVSGSSATTTDIVSITIAPTAPTVTGTGKTQSFIATGTSGTGSLEDVTTSVTWTSSDSSVATIGAKTGLATTTGTGTTFIIATYTNADGLKVTANTSLTVQ